MFVSCLASVTSAGPVEFSFVNITNNSNVNVEAQMSMFVAEVSGQPNQAAFIFKNFGSIGSRINDVYFDDGTLFGIASISNGSGTNFVQNASPGNLPGGNTLDPPFITSGNPGAMFSADSSNAPNGIDNGVNTGATFPSAEAIRITFNLINGKTVADVLSALSTPTGYTPGGAPIYALRVGLHVGSIEGVGANDSDGFVNVPGVVVPLPAAAWMGMTLLGSVGGVGFFRRRHERLSA